MRFFIGKRSTLTVSAREHYYSALKRLACKNNFLNTGNSWGLSVFDGVVFLAARELLQEKLR
jgi:hypothetical protein